MKLNIHGVTEIKIKKVLKGKSFTCRDIVITSKVYNVEVGAYVEQETTIDLFLANKEVAKLVYEK
tara:strand:- start:27 stop:221 length:195 start_codon:yes stop_codon:yes gene_type:complete